MVIQHNIMAMNAYRNYSSNASALASNLEKLSSGYKINRAGDDAAGLAISEKMRAQITGLEAAQKNVKDGVSLVKTAEGAMQEIQDMLNRMDYLATQSANGTYDNETDRANLQKEVDALKTEINRIADSANFNGIKLLDGSLEDGKTTSATKTIGLPAVGDILATNTILHKDAGEAQVGTSFSVDLHDTVFANQEGDTLTLTVGEGDGAATLSLTGKTGNKDGSDTMSGSDIVDELLANYSTVEINGQTFNLSKSTSGDDRLVFTQAKVPDSEDQEVKGNMNVTVTGALGGQKFIEAAKQTSQTATVQNGLGTTVSKTIDWTSNANVDLTSLAGKTFSLTDDGGTYTVTLTTDTVGSTDNTKVQVTNASDASQVIADIKTKLTALATAGQTTATADTTANNGATKDLIDAITLTGDNAGAITFSATTKTYTYASGTTSWSAGNAGSPATATTNVTAADKAGATIDWTSSTTIDMNELAGKKISVVVGGKTVSVELVASSGTAPDAADNTKLQLGATNDPSALLTSIQSKLQAQFDDIATTGAAGTKTYTEVTNLTLTGGTDGTITATADTQKYTARTDSSVVTGDHNFQTTDITDVSVNGKGRLAGTFFSFTKDMIQDGATLQIGTDYYTFTTDKAYADGSDSSKVYIGDLNSNSDDYVDAVGKRLTAAAADNKTWTVGYNNGTLSFEEIENQQEYTDEVNGASTLTSLEAIAKTFGWTGGASTGKALTLQIGDTSDEFNQMKVNVGDMHTSAMGTEGGSKISDIDISTQEGASAAIDVIKNAINYVSSIRGDLGAIQNRLEHTANNLSVMAENIQDAESTIRDTDVAEEMMSYVKNNILVQSAQAMLAQANQVPQGVLQLLG